MKKITKFFAIATVLAAFSAVTFAQATATATATIITPISISNTNDMSFGNIAVGSGGGTVVLPPVGARSVTGDVVLPGVTGTVQAAQFKVDGEGTSTYTIAITPASTTLTSGANTMGLGTFTSTPSGTGTLTGGTQNVFVGATLTVDAAEAPGVYTTAPGDEFTVTVNYN